MANRNTPKSRSRRFEILMSVAVAAYLALFLIAGTSGRVEVLLERARMPGAPGETARRAALVGAGMMAVLGVFMARALRRMGARRQALLAALASATLAVWQIAHLGNEGVYGALCAGAAALAFAVAARDDKGPPEDVRDL